jgi:hypothetical protein
VRRATHFDRAPRYVLERAVGRARPHVSCRRCWRLPRSRRVNLACAPIRLSLRRWQGGVFRLPLARRRNRTRRRVSSGRERPGRDGAVEL